MSFNGTAGPVYSPFLSPQEEVSTFSAWAPIAQNRRRFNDSVLSPAGQKITLESKHFYYLNLQVLLCGWIVRAEGDTG
ncbi:hypothetical protein HYFRA_00003950 [Hymenoscyphus fraxineus]|uniref:Uncharacterized protein n=1 Tax=Hymenoscyphus fraxineus TaxID=746836 RepID=A0A9N9KYW5_9HELO|nr:hypothetical protein HYFRA_00003950 [Hymenoscyphus fraxineus]